MIVKAIFFLFFLSALLGYSAKSHSFNFFVDHEKIIAKVDTTHPFPGACLIYKPAHDHPLFERVIYLDENNNSVIFVILRFPNSSHKGRQYLTGYHCPEGLIATMEAPSFHDKKIHDLAAHIQKNLLVNGFRPGTSFSEIKTLDDIANCYHCLADRFAFILEADNLFLLPNGAVFSPTGIDRYIKFQSQESGIYEAQLEGNILGYDLCSSLSEEKLRNFHEKYNKVTTALLPMSTHAPSKDREDEDQLLRVVSTVLDSEKKAMALIKRMPYLSGRWPTRLLKEIICDHPELTKEFHVLHVDKTETHHVIVHGKEDNGLFSISKIELTKIQ